MHDYEPIVTLTLEGPCALEGLSERSVHSHMQKKNVRQRMAKRGMIFTHW
jgi:hypothetical protein